MGTEKPDATGAKKLEDGKGGGATSLFFDGLPAMAGIVTIVAQPFAQDSMKKMFNLPDWLPMLMALIAAGLLSLYRTKIVKRFSPAECAICCPLLMLIIFSAYVTGNNVVFYAKSGVENAGQNISSQKVPEEALHEENSKLKAQLDKADDLIKQLSNALNISQAAPLINENTSSLQPLARFSANFGPAIAYAQGSDNKDVKNSTTHPTAENKTTNHTNNAQLQNLQKQLEEYNRSQQKLHEELKEIQVQRKTSPLIKSW